MKNGLQKQMNEKAVNQASQNVMTRLVLSIGLVVAILFGFNLSAFAQKSCKVQSNNRVISLSVKGQMPSAARVTATPVQRTAPQGKQLKGAYDITIRNGNAEWQPQSEQPVMVSITDPSFTDGELLDVYHEGVNGNEFVATVSPNNHTVTFPAKSFSVYIVTESGDGARLVVNFHQNASQVVTIYVKPDDVGEQFNTIVYDPGVGELASGVQFRGWTEDANYDSEDIASGMTIDGVRSKVQTVVTPLTSNDTLHFYAMLFKSYVVTYLDDRNATLGSHDVTFRADATSTAQAYVVNMAYTPQDNNHAFMGWLANQGGTHIAGWSEGTVYANGSNITISDDVVFGVNAPEGHWLVFDENGKGATYNAPQFVQSGATTSEPTLTMVRNGYTFGGWYTGAPTTQGGDPTGSTFTFGQQLSDYTTIYAKWNPRTTANYSIIVWKENVACNGYDFEELITASGTVGETINAVSEQGTGDNAYARINGTNYTYTGFHLDHFDEDVTITTEGDALLNVYYKRTEYTLTFRGNVYTYTATTNNSGTQYGTDDGNTYFRIYLNDGIWYRTRSGWGGIFGYDYSDPYYGTRYTQTGPSTQTVKTITAKYEQYIGDNFPISGNGASSEWRWKPVTPNDAGYTNVLVFIDVMPAANVTFDADESDASTKYMEFYVEALPGQTADRTWGGRSFVKYGNTIPAKYSYFTEDVDFPELVGYTKLGSDPAFDGDGEAHVSAGGTLYLYYDRNEYSIHFWDGAYVGGNSEQGDALEGYASQNELETVGGNAYGANVASYNSHQPPANKIPTGFIFEGWYLDATCTTPYTFTTMPASNMRVYAKWRQKRYRVFLHPNAGTDPTLDWGSTTQQMNFGIPNGGKLSAPYGRRTGYEFVGWFSDEACTNSFNADAFVLNDQTVPASPAYNKEVDMTDPMNKWGIIDPTPGTNSDAQRPWVQRKLDLYAKWRATVDGATGIRVVYDANGGLPEPTDPHFYQDNTSAVAAAAPEAPSSTQVFSHWVVQKWNGTTYENTSVNVFPGAQFTVLKNDALAEVTKWCKPDGTDTVSTYDETHTKVAEATYTLQVKAVYVPIEEATPTSIIWYKNDGTCSIVQNNENLLINQEVDIPAAPTRSGYKFLGWSKQTTACTSTPLTITESDFLDYHEADETHENPYYTAHNGTDVATQVAADQADPYEYLYAVWQIDGYTVHFDKNATGATGDMADQGFNVGQTATLSPNAFTYHCHTFAGWATSANATTATYTNEQSVTDLTTAGEEITLYAVWNESPLQLTVSDVANQTCENKGSFKVTVTNGTADYIYKLNGETVATSSESYYTYSNLEADLTTEPATAKTYTVYVEDTYGCNATTTQAISLTPSEITLENYSATVCSGYEFSYTPSENDDVTYSWPAPSVTGLQAVAASDGYEESVHGTLTLAEGETSGTAEFTVTPKLGVCTLNTVTVTVAVTLNVRPAVTITLTNPGTTCAGTQATVQATVTDALANSTLTWKLGETALATQTITAAGTSTLSQTFNVSSTCPDSQTLLVTYTDAATDACSASKSTEIKVGVPEWNVPAAGAKTVDCVSAVMEPTSALSNITDLCNNSIAPVLKSRVANPETITCTGTVVYTYTYTDCAGTSKEWTYTYTVKDTVAPVLTITNTPAATAAGSCQYKIPTVAYTVEDCNAVTVTQSPAADALVNQTDAEQTITITLTATACDKVSTKTTSVIIPAKPKIDVEIAENVEVCNGNYVTLEPTCTPATPTPAWQWSEGSNNLVTTQNYTVTPTESKTYKVKATATDDNGCKMADSANVTVTLLPLPSPSIATVDPVCSGSTVTLTGSLSEATTGSYTYTWSGLSETPIVETVTTTTHTVTVTAPTKCDSTVSVTLMVADGKGCTAQASGSFKTKKPTPVIATELPESTNLECNPTNIPFVHVTDFTVTDECNSAAVVTLDSTVARLFDFSCAYYKRYIAKYTSECGVAADSVMVAYVWAETEGPVITTTVADTIFKGCNWDKSDTVTAADFTVTDECQLSPQATVIHGEETTTGCKKSQSWTASYTNLCGQSATKVITYIWTADVTAPVIGTIADQNATPVGSGCMYKLPDLESATLTATTESCSELTFVSQKPAANTQYEQTDVQQIIVDTVIVKDGCDNKDTALVNIIIPAKPTISVNIVDTVAVCAGGSVILAPTVLPTTMTAMSVQWSLGTTHVSDEPTLTVTPTDTVTYTVTMTAKDNNGCEATASKDVTVAVNPVIEAVIDGPAAICAGETAELSVATGAASYAWAKDGTALTETSNKLSVSAAGTYTVTVTAEGGCISVGEKSVVVNPTYYTEETATTCANEPYTWTNHSVTIPTEVGTHIVWDSLTTVSGCDSVYKLTLTVNPTYYTEETATTCANEPYTWTNHSVTIPTEVGTHIVWDSLTTKLGCDSVYKLTLTVNPTYYTEETATTCANEPYTWTNHSVTIPTEVGVHTVWDSLTTKLGCDSVYKLTLTVNPTYYTEETASTCANEPYTWTNHSVTIPTEVGTHIVWDSLTTVSGCDSVYKLTLTVNPTYYTEETATTCANEPYTWTNHSVTIPTEVGTHIVWDSLTTVSGCDSVYKLTLTVNPIPTMTVTNASQTITYGNAITPVVITNTNSTLAVTTMPTGFTYNSSTQTITATMPNAGTYTITATATSNMTPSCGVVEKEIKIIVNKASLTISVDTAKKYDGTPFVVNYNAPAVTATGLVTGDYLTAGTMTTAEGTTPSYKVGTYTYLYSPSSMMMSAAPVTGTLLRNPDFNTNNGIENYNVSYALKLDITLRTLDITADDATKVYDGTALTSNGYMIDPVDGLATGDAATIAHAGSQTCVGTSEHTIGAVVVMKDGTTDVTDQYTIVRHAGTLEVTNFTDFTCPATETVVLNFGECDIEYTPTSTATVGAGMTPNSYVVANDLASQNPLTLGDHIITWTLSDTCGNVMATCPQTVTISLPPCPPATDADGIEYESVRIGCECWTKTNLKSEHYTGGADIPDVMTYYSPLYYNDEAANLATYGHLYTWEAAINGGTTNSYGHVPGICPDGWYLPTKEQYEELNSYGPDALRADILWADGGGTNTTGFTGLPGGKYTGALDRYEDMTLMDYYWATTTVGGTVMPVEVELTVNCLRVTQVLSSNPNGYSIRCIKEKE
ncbi:MAG: InlB B-repeat-containing protein [Bacteroidales bacterium]|nr:InlB B-repeat-containing protein [Bacteroidales bacterium]